MKTKNTQFFLRLLLNECIFKIHIGLCQYSPIKEVFINFN